MEKSVCSVVRDGATVPVATGARPDIGLIWSIQYLRAFAAILVVVFHQLGYRAPIFLLGRHGVDIFFVISGFIMVTMTDGRAISPASFALDRLTRIVPLYWLATLLVVLLAMVGVPIVGGSARLDWMVKSLLFIPGLNVDGQTYPTLFVGWTLNLEMIFYAIFALGLFLPAALRLPLLGAILIVLVCAPLLVQRQGVAMAFYANPLMLEFFAGAIIGSSFGFDLHRHSQTLTIVISVAVLLALAGAASLLPGMVAAWPAAALVVVGLLIERSGRMPHSPALKLLGSASFAIYLFQQFAFDAVVGLNNAALAALHVQRVAGVVQLACIVAAIALGIGVYSLVERPLTAAVRAWAARSFGMRVRLRTS